MMEKTDYIQQVIQFVLKNDYKADILCIPVTDMD